MLYLAEIELVKKNKKQPSKSAPKRTKVLVKFAHRYSVKAHEVCAAAGCAPVLFHHGAVCDNIHYQKKKEMLKFNVGDPIPVFGDGVFGERGPI